MSFSNEPDHNPDWRPLLSIEEIKSRVTMFDLWKHLELPGDPTSRRIFSPFRQERSPSFAVFDDGRRWKDFGGGQFPGGDVIDFWMAATGVDRKDAIKDLRTYCGQPEIASRPTRRPPPAPALYPDPVPENYLAMGHQALRNFDDRKNTGELHCLNRLRINKKWDWSLFKFLPIGVFPDGSNFRTKDDKFIPISGKIAYVYPHGLKCRPKYDTSHQDFWVSGKALFNVWRGERLEDQRIRTVVIFEGETDLISGMNAYAEPEGVLYISIPGASWTPLPYMASLIGSHRRVILCLDDDTAGREATSRLTMMLAASATYCEATEFPWSDLIFVDAANHCVGDIGDLWVHDPALLTDTLHKLINQ